MEFINVKEKKIAFSLKGEGPVIVFLHGFCEDQSMWAFFEKEIIDADFQFLSIDLPGFGYSDTIKVCSIHEMATLVEAVVSQLQLKEIILIGHSMGGYVSLAFAERFSHHLKGLGLFHSHPYADGAQKKEARQKSIQFINKSGSAPYIKQLIPKLFPSDFAANNPQIIQPLINKAQTYDPDGITNALDAMKNRPDRSKVLSESKVPVLFVVGEEDDLEPQETLIKQTYLPNVASIHLLQGIGHMGIFEAPEKTSKLVVDFAQFCWSKN